MQWRYTSELRIAVPIVIMIISISNQAIIPFLILGSTTYQFY